MKETIAKIMRSGGYAVILATIAMALYLLVIEMGDRFIANQTVPLKITIDENGYMYTNYGGDKEDVYVLWQTDGGNIQPVEKNEKLAGQYEEGNKWYFAYTGPNEKVKWSSKDADGFEYEKATIRATVYLAEQTTGVFHVYEYINEVSVTVEEKNNTVVKAEDRYFSNPVRKGEDKDWSQIYKISSDDDKTETYMFRTGSEIKNAENMILVWEANSEILNETDLISGTVDGFKVNPEKSGKGIIAATPSITVNSQNMSSDFYMEAYLTYSSNSEKKPGEIISEEKFYRADHNITDAGK
ncbi:MAG: hypothetical protein E7266_08705 [Lachnospiraceae bacterium]|nr:hypothetical protein [Lachnospiraceae bacterium]